MDLDWLHVVVELYEGDSMRVDYSHSSHSSAVADISKGIQNLDNFTITELIEGEAEQDHSSAASVVASATSVDDAGLLQQYLSSTSIHAPSYTSSDTQDLEGNMKRFSPFDPSQQLQDQQDQQDAASSSLLQENPLSRAETPAAAVGGMSMDVDNESQDSFSDDDDDDDDDANNNSGGDMADFFNSSFTKKAIPPLSLSPNLQVMNMMLHWVTWKTQKFASILDYKPHLNTATMYVHAQHEEDMDTNTSDDMDTSTTRHLPAVDGIDVEQSRRQVVSNFIMTRLASIRSYIPEIESFNVKKTLEALLSTFDLAAPMEPLKTSQWNTITVSLLYAITPRHSGLAQLLEANRTLLEQQCSVDFSLVKDLQGMFVHHG